MNRLRNAASLFLTIGMALTSASCDKAKQAVTAAKEKFRGVDPSAPATPGGDVAPDLASQVDSAAEGVRFRRDLPFPTELSVRSTERFAFENARVVSTSELGAEKAPLTGKFETIVNLDRKSSQLTIQIEKAGIIVEQQEGEKKDSGKAVVPVAESSNARDDAAKRFAGATIEFRYTGKGWRTPDSKGPVDFNRMLWAKQLQPALPEVMAGGGVMPRTQWFSSTRRWNGGDKFELSGDSIALLFPGKSSGKITLTYEIAEAVEGHPCGRFAVNGDVSLKDFVAIEGEVTDREISIRSGKVWCSLLYPLVLREDLETVQTITENRGGAKIRIQGGLNIVRTRQWKQ